MDAILRGTAVYLFLLVVFRLAGKRTLNKITTFDAVLLLIISESVQQAMLDSDSSMTNAFLLILTLVGIDIALSCWKRRSQWLEKLLDGVPVVVIENGVLHRDRMARERIDEADILAAARERQGLERMDQIKHAVMEDGGTISIIPQGR